jgi:hypothetical protein
MITQMTVEYDCGHVYSFPIALPEGSTLLHNAALGDTMLGMADATHDAEHPECLVSE